MSHHYPTDTMTADEGQKLRALIRAKGPQEAAKIMGLCDFRTLLRAASETPIARLSAEVIRGRLDRI